MSVRLEITDEQTGDTETVRVPDGDYFLLATDPCTVDTMAYATGTHVLTIKGRSPKPLPDVGGGAA